MRLNKRTLLASAAVGLLVVTGAVAELDCPTIASGGNTTDDSSILVVGQVIAGGTGAANDMAQGAVPCWFAVIPGDLNCDGVVDFGDINPFVDRLVDPAQYAADYPDCPDANGDIDGNGSVGFEDINPFVSLLTGA